MKEICVILPGVRIGSRVECDGENATVRYIGDVDSTPALWLGVEWDNQERGKHDGFYKGKQYFSTRHPNAGSFVRPQKVFTGRSFVEALQERYEDTIVDNLPEEERKLDFSQHKVIEFVGAEKMAKKISRLSLLREANLPKMGISSLGTPNSIRSLVPNIVELDLSRNLLSSWEQVAGIAGELPLLQSLILSENRLQKPLDTKLYEKSFMNLKTLVLNKMDISWNEVSELSTMWPKLETLTLCSNTISQIQPPANYVLRNLSSLDLSHNSLFDWKDVCNLGNLPRLQELILSDNCITELYFSDAKPGQKTSLFPMLKSVSLARNNIVKWEEISELNKLPKLQKLKIGGNSLLRAESFETTRQLTIAKLGSLLVLEGIVVTRQERRGAELDYLKRFYGDWQTSKGKGLLQEFYNVHPRYAFLVKEHGASEESEVEEKKPALKNALLSVEIYSPQVPEKAPIKRKLPATMTVGKLKALVHRLYNVSIQELRLSYTTAQEQENHYDLNNDLRELAFYDLKDSNRICVQW